MTERPRPQYGEYASPEEQADASGVPAAPAPAPTAMPEVQPYTTRPYEPPPPAPRQWDRIVTGILIAVGLYSVLNYFGTLTNLGAVIGQSFTTAGYGEFQSQALANQLGTVALVIVIVLFAVSTTLSLLSLRKRRISFWIPLTAGALALITVFAVMLVIVFADPGFQAYVESISTQ